MGLTNATKSISGLGVEGLLILLFSSNVRSIFMECLTQYFLARGMLSRHTFYLQRTPFVSASILPHTLGIQIQSYYSILFLAIFQLYFSNNILCVEEEIVKRIAFFEDCSFVSLAFAQELSTVCGRNDAGTWMFTLKKVIAPA